MPPTDSTLAAAGSNATAPAVPRVPSSSLAVSSPLGVALPLSHDGEFSVPVISNLSNLSRISLDDATRTDANEPERAAPRERTDARSL
jgi:hypothetical protein